MRNKQIGWGIKENLLWEISKKLEKAIKVAGGGNVTTTSTTTTP